MAKDIDRYIYILNKQIDRYNKLGILPKEHDVRGGRMEFQDTPDGVDLTIPDGQMIADETLSELKNKLTPIQLQVLEMMFEGLTRRQMAEDLNKHYTTIDEHVDAIRSHLTKIL